MASALLLVVGGCSNNNIDTAKVRAAFQSGLDQGQKDQLEIALADIEAAKYKDALLPLRKVAFGAKLDSSQRKILKDTMEKVQRKIAQTQ